jgi:putative ABC transport system substrate-binding protein
LPALAADLVRRQVAVIFASGGQPPLRAAMAATTTIPIIFNVADDPVSSGYVASLNRPGGNVTGVNFLAEEVAAKRFELLRELLPKATMTALLVNPDSPTSQAERQLVEATARAVGHEILILNASTARDIEAAFSTLVESKANALLVTVDSFILRQRAQIAELAARHAIPTVVFEREFVAAGALMSYGSAARLLSSSRRLCRPNPQGRQARRPAGCAGDKVRARHQSQDRSESGTHGSTNAECRC